MGRPWLRQQNRSQTPTFQQAKTTWKRKHPDLKLKSKSWYCPWSPEDGALGPVYLVSGSLQVNGFPFCLSCPVLREAALLSFDLSGNPTQRPQSQVVVVSRKAQHPLATLPCCESCRGTVSHEVSHMCLRARALAGKDLSSLKVWAPCLEPIQGWKEKVPQSCLLTLTSSRKYSMHAHTNEKNFNYKSTSEFGDERTKRN